MPNKNRPATPNEAPDPANSYERARPENESVGGRLGPPELAPSQRPDDQARAISNARPPTPQANIHDDPAPQTPEVTPRTGPGSRALGEPDHSMHEEEGLDEYPADITEPQKRRHPRRESEGGSP